MKRTPSVILGLCSYTHDSSAALLVDGELVGFVEEERLSEQKHTKLYPALAVGWLLDQAKLSAGDVDAVAYNFQPVRYLAESPAALRMALSPMTHDRSLARAHGFAKVALRTRRRLRVLGSQFPSARVTPILHHRAHQLTAFVASGWEEAAVLVVDSLGERQTTTIAHGHS
ncbi:carbamoyltransferase, partial [Streptomyces sp. SID5926]|nr:carbamoyltransferase [Streptomyces sp. SID5926]